MLGQEDEPEPSPTDTEPLPEDNPEPDKLYCGLVDLDKGTVSKVEGSFNEITGSKIPDATMSTAASSQNYAYIYLPDTENNREGWMMRLSYDAANNKMNYEDLTPTVKQVIGPEMMPVFERPVGKGNVENYYTLAGLPDGVAIIGSPTAGEDTHIIKDGSTELITYPRTSSYHQAFYILATYGDGYLYAMGNNATEPDVAYFRSTQYPQPEPEPTPGPEPTPTPEPVPYWLQGL